MKKLVRRKKLGKSMAIPHMANLNRHNDDPLGVGVPYQTNPAIDKGSDPLLELVERMELLEKGFLIPFGNLLHSYWKWSSRNSGFSHYNIIAMVDLSSSQTINEPVEGQGWAMEKGGAPTKCRRTKFCETGMPGWWFGTWFLWLSIYWQS